MRASVCFFGDQYFVCVMVWASTDLGWFLGVADTNDVIQKIEKTLNNTHTTTQKLTNNSFRNTKKHPDLVYALKSKANHFQSLLKNEGKKNSPGEEGRILCLLSPSLPVCRGGRVAEGQVYADDWFPISIAMEAPLF